MKKLDDGIREIYEVLETLNEGKKEKFNIFSSVLGKQLEGIVFSHPFFERDSVMVLADYVTADTGSGCVHTAPGHGQEDFETGQR